MRRRRRLRAALPRRARCAGSVVTWPPQHPTASRVQRRQVCGSARHSAPHPGRSPGL